MIVFVTPAVRITLLRTSQQNRTEKKVKINSSQKACIFGTGEQTKEGNAAEQNALVRMIRCVKGCA